MTTRVVLAGGTGRLGSIIHRVIDETDGFDLLRVLGSGDDPGDLDGADLVVDATTPAASGEVVRAAIARGVNVLVGTSGWPVARIDEIRPLVAEAGTGAVFIPNFSLGSVLGTALAVAAAPYFSSVEIVEAHRDTKIDSPSGTAVRTAELIAATRGDQGPAPFAEQPARGEQVAGIPVHALRLPGVLARQDVILSGPGETLTLSHDTVVPADAYAPGIRLALPFARDARGMVVGLEHLIDLRIGRP